MDWFTRESGDIITIWNYTMVSRERFNTILRHENTIAALPGDIVECGVWRGGMSIFLSKLFDTKNIWVCDSFDGFQATNDSVYQYPNERHVKGKVGYSVSLDEVKNNFALFDVPNMERVTFLKGFVKDTLNPATCQIQEIALLRIDVDAYSATREVLDALYPKVVSGGYIIFDDTCLHESLDAIRDYFKAHDIPLVLHHPGSDDIITTTYDYPCGCYYIKP